MSSKTRYNIRVAQKHGVTIQEENTEEAFARYLKLTQETTTRQGFYAHSLNYHRLMWRHLYSQLTTHNSQPIAHLLTARYQGKILVTWIIFLFNNVLYYPYGASSSEHKEVMASNLMMWEAIKWGKQNGARLFDLWGTPGPDPKPTDPYYGFHRFKTGYGPKLVEFVGSYDLVLKQPHYQFFTLTDKFRWFLFKLKAKLLPRNSP
jgi:lipid II:glycine glycyltransferase (peptidoglycan interpeptide bridge formation enzyme)